MTGMNIYEALGVQTVINAAGTMTRLGGALMPPEVVQAMAQAAEYHVRIEELQQRAGEIIAELTGAEAGYVTCGAAAGLMLGAAACVAGLDIHKMERLPDTSGMKNEVIVQRPHRNSYDHAIRAVGVKLVEVGWLGHPTPRPVQPWEIEAAINERTAAIYWAVMANTPTVGLAETVAVGRRHNVPVIVDAAAGLPPTRNLRAFIEAGADLVSFSGGKTIRGPQASGVLAGRRDLIQSVALQHQDMDVYSATWFLRAGLLDSGLLPGPPLQGIGRSLKVGKEEIVGLITALRLFVERDEAAEQAEWLAIVRMIAGGVADLPGVEADILPNTGRAAIPLARITWDEERLGVPGPALVNGLAEGRPPICVSGDGQGGEIIFNPFSLTHAHAELITRRLQELLRKR
jgi:L-seryl-tRNA(Ser) seleniumtransferase